MVKNVQMAWMAGLAVAWAAVAGAVQEGEETAMAKKNAVEVLRAANEGIRRVVLDNGLIVLLKEDHSAPMAAIQYWVRAGAIDEGEWLGGGLSHYLEHMVFKGTEKRGPGEVSKAIADAGGDINAYTASDRTVFHATLPAAKWEVGLDVLTDAVFHPTFPEDEWAREREVILREVAMGEDDPNRVMSKLTWETAYRVHPYRVPVIGWKDILTTMGRKELAEYHRRHYSPDNMILAVAGAVGLDEMERKVRETAGAEKRRPVEKSFVPAEPEQRAERRARKEGDWQVSRVAWAFHSTSEGDGDTAALDVLASVVGSGRSSRLTSELREKRRLVHAVDAWNYTPADPGLFGIDAECDPEKEAEVEAALRAEVARWKEELFGEEELERARREVLTYALGELETMEGQAAEMASGEFYAGDPRLMERYVREVSEVTPERLREVARKWLREENGSWVVLGPRAAGREGAGEGKQGEMKLEMRTLPNGVRVVVREDARLPLVSVAAFLGGGALGEPEGKSGLARLTAALLTRGTPSRSAAEWAEWLERKGISLAGTAGRNTYGLQARGLSSEAETMLEAVADCLLHPVFDEGETATQRGLQAAAVKKSMEQPMWHAQRMALEGLFGGHPYGKPQGGLLEEVEGLTRTDAAAYHERMAVPGNLVVAVFGDVETEETVSRLEALLGQMPRGPAPVFPELPEGPKGNARMETKGPFQQTVVVKAWRGPGAKDAAETAADFLDETLSGLSSDLFIEVRDKRGLAYYTGATRFGGLPGGCFQIYSGTTEEGEEEVERQIGVQTRRLAEEGPREEERARAAAQLLASAAAAGQQNASLASECAVDELLGMGYRHFLESTKEIEGTTAEDMRAAAEGIFGGACVTAVVRPNGEAPEEEGEEDGGEGEE